MTRNSNSEYCHVISLINLRNELMQATTFCELNGKLQQGCHKVATALGHAELEAYAFGRIELLSRGNADFVGASSDDWFTLHFIMKPGQPEPYVSCASISGNGSGNGSSFNSLGNGECVANYVAMSSLGAAARVAAPRLASKRRSAFAALI